MCGSRTPSQYGFLDETGVRIDQPVIRKQASDQLEENDMAKKGTCANCGRPNMDIRKWYGRPDLCSSCGGALAKAKTEGENDAILAERKKRFAGMEKLTTGRKAKTETVQPGQDNQTRTFKVKAPQTPLVTEPPAAPPQVQKKVTRRKKKKTAAKRSAASPKAGKSSCQNCGRGGMKLNLLGLCDDCSRAIAGIPQGQWWHILNKVREDIKKGRLPKKVNPDSLVIIVMKGGKEIFRRELAA
jgi:ribosomal protein S14